MCRGHGRRQRQILETLGTFPSFYLASLTTDNTIESKSLNRAAKSLAAAGEIQLNTYSMSMYQASKTPKTITYRKRGHSYDGNNYVCQQNPGGPRLVVSRSGTDGKSLDRDVLEKRLYEIRANAYAISTKQIEIDAHQR
jgi:hypothetical protein